MNKDDDDDGGDGGIIPPPLCLDRVSMVGPAWLLGTKLSLSLSRVCVGLCGFVQEGICFSSSLV